MTIDTMHAAELFRAPPNRLIEVEQGHVAYRRIGEGPDVLFVHGWPVSGATFRTLLPYLAPHVTCHVLDLVGAGDSRFERRSRIDLATHIHSVRRVADALGLTRFAAVGHDSGGLIARHALAEDGRLTGLVLLGTEQPAGLHPNVKRFLLLAKLPGFAHALAWAVNHPTLRSHPMVLGGCFRDPAHIGGDFETFFLRPLADEPDRRWAAGQLARHFDTGLVDQLGELHAKIRVPVRLVWGREDPFFPLGWARSMVHTFPQASLHVVKRARLFAHEEHPEEVAEAMLPTLLSAAHTRVPDGGAP